MINLTDFIFSNTRDVIDSVYADGLYITIGRVINDASAQMGNTVIFVKGHILITCRIKPAPFLYGAVGAVKQIGGCGESGKISLNIDISHLLCRNIEYNHCENGEDGEKT